MPNKRGLLLLFSILISSVIFIFFTFYMSIFVGLILTAINLYGLLFKDFRVRNISSNNLRFPNKLDLTFNQVLDLVEKKPDESKIEYADRLPAAIKKSIAHIHWEKYPPDYFHQRIPIWENYLLYLISILTNKPEYNRYHIADYKKSLYRGIGVCGDASMIMSQLLAKNHISNSIISYKDHVVVEAYYGKDNHKVYDPDFGVVLPYSIESIRNNPEILKPFYLDQGFKLREIEFLVKTVAKDYEVWNGVSHFIKKRYYIEKVSYFLKWPFPMFMIIFPIYFSPY